MKGKLMGFYKSQSNYGYDLPKSKYYLLDNLSLRLTSTLNSSFVANHLSNKMNELSEFDFRTYINNFITSYRANISISSHWFKNNRRFYRVYPPIAEYLTQLGAEICLYAKIENKDILHGVNMPAISCDFMRDAVSKIELPHSMIVERCNNNNGSILYFDNGFMYEEYNVFNVASSFDETTLLDITKSNYNLDTLIISSVFFPFGFTAAYRNNSLLEPIVLKDDMLKYNTTNDIKYVQKAIRHRINGCIMGKNFVSNSQSIPGTKCKHYRKPHKVRLKANVCGRKEEKIIIRKGSYINLFSFLDIPTGSYSNMNKVMSSFHNKLNNPDDQSWEYLRAKMICNMKLNE